MKTDEKRLDLQLWWLVGRRTREREREREMVDMGLVGCVVAWWMAKMEMDGGDGERWRRDLIDG